MESKDEEEKETEEKIEEEKEKEKVDTEEKETDTVNIMMCEWDGCGKTFATSTGVIVHCAKDHVTEDPLPCKWPGCDGTPRSK